MFDSSCLGKSLDINDSLLVLVTFFSSKVLPVLCQNLSIGSTKTKQNLSANFNYLRRSSY